jgi:DNA relaxase NicK
MLDYYRAVRKRDLALGYKEQTGGAFGFLGKKCRHSMYGDKGDWGMVQASGYEAKHSLRLAGDGTQATRIDLQVTYWVGEENVERCIRAAYDSACDTQNASHRPSRVNLIESRHKAQTVYVGSRASDVFLRIYDKFEESKKSEYLGCVRFELELKGRMSKALWKKLIAGETNLRGMLEMTVAMLLSKGVSVPSNDIEEMDVLHLKAEPTGVENQLAWLQNQVAPTVKRLVAEYGWITPFRVLFEEALTSLRTRRIMKSLGIVWGS